MDKGNIKLSGNGSISEGEYKDIKIMGNAISNGRVKAEKITIMGSADLNSSIEVKECIVFGNAIIRGNMRAEKFKVNGDLTIVGDCEVGELSVNGKTDIDGMIECNNVVIRGDMILTKACQSKTLKVYGSVDASSDLLGEEISIDGKVQCKGLLSGETVCLHAFENSYCKEIGATKLVVEKPIYHLLWFGYGKKNSLSCDLIEADEIKVEYTKAKIIRGKQVILNKQCEVDTLEYSEQYTKGEDCQVREVTKVD